MNLDDAWADLSRGLRHHDLLHERLIATGDGQRGAVHCNRADQVASANVGHTFRPARAAHHPVIDLNEAIEAVRIGQINRDHIDDLGQHNAVAYDLHSDQLVRQEAHRQHVITHREDFDGNTVLGWVVEAIHNVRTADQHDLLWAVRCVGGNRQRRRARTQEAGAEDNVKRTGRIRFDSAADNTGALRRDGKVPGMRPGNGQCAEDQWCAAFIADGKGERRTVGCHFGRWEDQAGGANQKAGHGGQRADARYRHDLWCTDDVVMDA